MLEPLADMNRILALLATDPLSAADAIDGLADRLHGQADMIRNAMAKEQSPFKVPGGIVDIVKMNVVGPNGEIKQSITTQ
jgi:hypothetical protein